MTPAAIPYPGDSLPAALRRPFRLLGLLAVTRQWRIVPAALGLPIVPERLELRLGPARYALRTRPASELRIDLGILWEIAIARVYPLPDVAGPLAVVDIGAHRGHFVVWAASHRPGAEIHAYEPDEGNADELEEAVRRAGLMDRVTVHREAVAARDGTRAFRPAARSDAGGLADGGRPVPAVSLATAIARCRAERVLLKVDAEGAEHEAFAALASGDMSPARRIVGAVVEWHSPAAGETDVRRSLAALGFELRSRMLGIGNGIVHAWRAPER